ncbi:MAG: hypothetical protein LW636_11140, partial [Planctomycetaceae bacterium]|nr:hypothetical protein [Planctomycetaceae bacterium]
MKNTRSNQFRTLAASLALAAASFAVAQDGTFPPPGGGGQDGQRPGGGGGMRGGDPAQFVERLMQQDANGDGKLAKDEMQGPMAERLFDRADANKDGFVDRAELEEMAKSGQMGRGQGGQGAQGGQAGRGGAGGAPNLEGAMRQAQRAYRTLSASSFTAESRKADLDSVQQFQMAIFGAKGGIANAPMSAKAKEKFGDDKAAYEAEFRKALLKSGILAANHEHAILDGDAAKAKALVTQINESQESGHA